MSYNRKAKTEKPTAAERTNTLFEEITASIVSAIEKSLAEGNPFTWVRPWANAEAFKNAISGKAYRGINPLLLSFLPFGDPRFITFKQGLALVRKSKSGDKFLKEGQKATRVIFWKFYEKKDSSTGNIIDRFALLRYYSVFNVDQTNLVELGLLPAYITPDVPPFVTNDRAEKLVEVFHKNMGVQIREGGDKACYTLMDMIYIPKRDTFNSASAFYRTLFHEMVHATGHTLRLNRDGITKFDRFGTEQYADEELIAEIGSAMLAALAGLEPDADQSAAYVGGWLSRLKNDTRLIERAARQAQKAVDLILKTEEEDEEEGDEEE